MSGQVLKWLRSAVRSAVFASAGLLLSQPLALANPAAAPTNFNQTTAGGIASTTVPDGVCGVSTIVAGAGGATNIAAVGALGGNGGSGAVINATFKVLPSQVVTGTVAAGGTATNAANPAVAQGGAGNAAGGNAGTVADTPWHRGGGGGGSSAVFVGGVKIIEAGGGGGGGGAHQSTTVVAGGYVGDGGSAGTTGIGAGVAAPGRAGNPGVQNTGTVGGGGGGAAAAGGTGGVNSTTPARNGAAGLVTGAGGNGGPDNLVDTGGGGGGGFTGGGGGSSTNGDGVTGAGGGGGSSWVRATSPTVAAPAPTGISGAVATAGNPGAGGVGGGSNNGTAGRIALTWVPCNYTLVVNKTSSAASVNAGGRIVWTVTVQNTGPDPMTRGDVITLGDTLPGPVTGTPTYQILSIANSGGTNSTDLANGAITCPGFVVGNAMPSSLVCSRPYDASAAPGAPAASGRRGLNPGETLTITYEQIFPNTATCNGSTTITNTASVNDRSIANSFTLVARSEGETVALNCYDLAVTKSALPASVGSGGTITWSVSVVNNGPANMFGPNATTANPLIVNDVAPTLNIGTPFGFTSSGPAGACTYSAGVITCPGSLNSGQTQTFTFKQTVNVGAPNGAINNTASVTDFRTGDSNDSSTASSTVVAPAPAFTIVKARTGSGFVNVGNVITYTYTVTNTGNVPITGVTVSDVTNGFNGPVVPAGEGSLVDAAPLLDSTDGSVNGSWDLLGVGDRVTFTGTYTVVQSDIDLRQ